MAHPKTQYQQQGVGYTRHRRVVEVTTNLSWSLSLRGIMTKLPAPAPEPQWQPHPPQTLHEAPAVEREITEEEATASTYAG